MSKRELDLARLRADRAAQRRNAQEAARRRSVALAVGVLACVLIALTVVAYLAR